MTDLTPEGLEELKALLDAATPGGWQLREDNYQSNHVWTLWDTTGNGFVLDMVRPLRSDLTFEWVDQRTKNFQAIAALKSNGPALIRAAEENAATRERIAKWMILHSVATGHGDTVEDLLDELDVELSQLRARLAKAEVVVESAIKFRDEGTRLTSCDRGACQQVIEKRDKSDPQALLYKALASYSAKETEG